MRCPSPSSWVSWRRRRIPPPLLLGFEGFTVPALPRSSTNRNGKLLCPVRVVRWTSPPHIVRNVSSCSSPQDVARRRFRRTQSPSGSGRQYLGRTSFQGDPYRGLLREPGRPGVLLRLFFLRRTSLSPRC